MLAVYTGEAAKGARFVEDPVMRSKALTLPQLQLQITFEGRRLRLDDISKEEPDKSQLIKNAGVIYNALCSNYQLEGFGFNFDTYFRFNQFIPIKDLFERNFGPGTLQTADLRDFGFQFTLDKSKDDIMEIWFMKITSPLELAAHINRHFKREKLPGPGDLHELFLNCYNEMDKVVGDFKF